MLNGGSQKLCARCRTLKPLADFSLRDRARGVLHTYCRACHAAWNREHYQRNRATYLAHAKRNNAAYQLVNLEKVLAYFQDHPCVDCGERDPLVLEFDHRERTRKRIAVSNLLRYSTSPQVAVEIAKCDVRCANCHRRRTARQFGWRKLLASLSHSAGAAGLEPATCRFGDDRSTN